MTSGVDIGEQKTVLIIEDHSPWKRQLTAYIMLNIRMDIGFVVFA